MRLLLTGLSIVFASSVFAESRVFGKWASLVENDEAYASTINDSGGALGQYCAIGTETCYWLLAISVKCKKDSKYPLLVNTDDEATPVEILCRGSFDKGSYAYVFADFDVIDRLVKNGNRIGFAFPLHGDQFRVIRFDLRGAKAAITNMRENAAEKVIPASKKTKDVLM